MKPQQINIIIVIGSFAQAILQMGKTRCVRPSLCKTSLDQALLVSFLKHLLLFLLFSHHRFSCKRSSNILHFPHFNILHFHPENLTQQGLLGCWFGLKLILVFTNLIRDSAGKEALRYFTTLQHTALSPRKFDPARVVGFILKLILVLTILITDSAAKENPTYSITLTPTYCIPTREL